MKKKLKIYFEDMWGYDQYTFNPYDNYFYDLLSIGYDVQIDPNPDILIFSVFGNRNTQYSNCKKIFFLGENYSSNYKSPESVNCDISLSQFNTSNTNYYLPLWVIFVDWFNKQQPRPLPSNPTFCIPITNLLGRTQYKNDKFCCFINNNPVADRVELFNNLSTYRKIDSYGTLFNNVGYTLRGSEEDKINTLTNYKFTIAYENSYNPGYNTEKIVQPLSVNCIPIYSGGEKIKDYIDCNSFIFANDYKCVNDLIEYIKFVDTDNSEYEKFINTRTILTDKALAEFNPLIILNWISSKLNV